MVVRTMHIDEHFAETREDCKGSGRPVDELAIRTGGSEGAFEDELMIFAGFKAILFEKRGKIGNVFDAENSFDGAGIGSATDEGPVGALSEHQIQSANNDGFAGAGLARDGIVAGSELEGEVGHESKVLDAERGQHGRIKTNGGKGARKKILRTSPVAEYGYRLVLEPCVWRAAVFREMQAMEIEEIQEIIGVFEAKGGNRRGQVINRISVK